MGVKMSWELLVIHAGCFLIGILLEDLYGIADKIKNILRVRK